MRVADGVLRFRVPMPANPNVPDGGLGYTLVYGVETRQGTVIIDAGLDSEEGFQALRKHLAEAGIRPTEVALVVITHGHPDHAGLANRVKELTGARLAMHRRDAAPARGRGQAFFGDPEAMREWMARWGVPAEELGERPQGHPGHRHRGDSPWRPEPPAVDLLLEGGEEVLPGSDLWAVWTPGHSPGHLCLYDRGRRLLFSGDHVLPIITPHVSLYPGEDGDPLGQFLESQRKVRELDVVMVHPAHEHSFADLRARVDQILGHHRERMDEMVAQVQDSPQTAWQVASCIKWNVGPWDQLGTWTKRMALFETLAHLRHMLVSGELSESKLGKAVRYGLP